MIKRFILAFVAVFVSLSAIDFLLHVVVLGGQYEIAPKLWRPDEEMKMGLGFVVGLVAVFCFLFIYARFFKWKCIGAGLQYGFWYGLAAGMTMGYGSYSAMPIPYPIALGWFFGMLVEWTLAGLIVGAIVREPAKAVAAGPE